MYIIKLNEKYLFDWTFKNPIWMHHAMLAHKFHSLKDADEVATRFKARVLRLVEQEIT